MSKIQRWFLAALFATCFRVPQAQVSVPEALPEPKYPPIARAAKVQGDVVVSFRLAPEGRTAAVMPVSGPTVRQGVAVENVKPWRFNPKGKQPQQAYKVTFHFRLDPPDDGYDDGQA